MEINFITQAVIAAAIEVHKALGPGLLESAYKPCLHHELVLNGYSASAEVPVPLEYKGLIVPCAYRMDLLVENKVIVEIKCAEKLINVHEAQLINYLKLTRMKVGLLINFHEKTLIQGLRRIIN